MRRFVLAVVVLAACSGTGPQFLGAQPSWRGGDPRTIVAGPVTFAPAGESVSRYNEPLAAVPHTALNDAVIAAVQDAAVHANVRAPIADPRLFRACAELAEIVPEEGIVGYTLVEFALQRNGIIEPSPHLLVVWEPLDPPQLIIDQLGPRIAEILADGSIARLGIGAAKRSADGSGAVVFALQGSGVSTAPIPRTLAAGGSTVLDAVVDAHYRDPEVFVTHDDGVTEQLALQPGRPGGFTAQLACAAHRGRQQIEITASDATGPTVLANFPLWCGAAPPASVTIDPAHDDAPAATAEEAERRVFASVNRDRGAAGLLPLVWDDRLAAVARAHSAEMQRTHIVAHVSPATGSSADRVRAANIKTTLVLENVARAYGVNEAHQGLMNSPGHRANIMSSAATQIGIGVVFGDEISGRREMFITQVFTRVPPVIDRAATIEAVRKKLVVVRRALAVKPELSAVAQDLATALAAGATREAASQHLKPKLDGFARGYQRLSSVIIPTTEVDGLDGASLLGDVAADDVGIGVAQGMHPELGANAIWIVLLLGTHRH
ncbi:MAG TPA: CAP domain-containing protein [Kofleriaceae bacterium]|jgi:uncharacterized protein YkwD|nr:CAP domain-containing protein [Kofleriaceae bacterium]